MKKVKAFDCEHELDLEHDINKFISNEQIEVIDIKFSVAVASTTVNDIERQVFCYSALVIYEE